MAKLTDARIRILIRLADRKIDRDGAETAREIAHALGVSNTGPVLASLMQAGFVKRLGVAFGTGNASTWTITDAGRSALSAARTA